ncbi:MAG: glycine cleavage system protein H [Thermodesulfobacteriota bacterium]
MGVKGTQQGQRKKKSVEGRPCIWMQTGVVRRKHCDSDYACVDCRFESAMRRTVQHNNGLKRMGAGSGGRAGRIVAWEEKVKALPPSKRPCIHSLKGRIRFKSCTNEYRCDRCEFDQFFSDGYAVQAVVKPIGFLQVEGFRLPQGYYLHQGHAWARMEEASSIRVGIDEFGLRLLGPLDRVEAPLVGKPVKQGQPQVLLSRGTHQARLLSPVSGVVTAVNLQLRERGTLANRDPYTEGWVMTVHATDLRDDLKGLMINQESARFLGEEVERLQQAVQETCGPLAADGGYWGDDIFGSLPQIGWESLTRTFLRS